MSQAASSFGEFVDNDAQIQTVHNSMTNTNDTFHDLLTQDIRDML
jgi:hypothetical protein